eukprot:XP_019926719.1 PREDICTED: CAP-Gly domain-containing linker protein 1-like isoform X2 [Crassostrea gigas]
MQRINTDAVDKSKSLFQNENASLKLAYEQATFKIKDLSKQFTNAKRDKENAESQIDSLSNILFHKKKELESVQNELARSKEDVLILSKDIKDIQSSKRLADEKLQGLQTENASLKSALSKATNEIEDLVNKGSNLQKYKADAEHKTSTLMNSLREKGTENEALREQLARAEKKVSILSKDIKDMQASKRQVAEEKLQSLQTENTSLKSALSKATNEIEDIVNKTTNLQKYNTDAEHKTSTLMNALREKDTENKALREQLARAEKNVSILSKDIKDVQASKRQVAEEKLQSLQTENASLKSALSKATNEIEDLLNKDTNLQKYKTDAEHKTSSLMNALKDKETEIEALSKQLARSEENVSILSKDIKNIQESKRQVADGKLQDLQTENDSLKLTLAEATTKIDDLWNKCTNLQKYKSDTELEIGTLLNVVEEKETEIETLHKHLARSEKNVSILSKDIKDIQGSKRQAADEKVQSLQTENASIKLELAKATTEIDAFRNKCTDLQKYKTDTEHTINSLLNAVKEKETKFEALNTQLARYKEKIWTLTKTVEDIKGSKNQAADENIKGLQKKIGSLESELRNATTEMNDLSYKYKCLQKDKESAEYTINKLSRDVQEKEKEISSLIEDLAKANEKGDREEHAASANSIQKLTDENASLNSKLSQLSNETEKKVSALTKEIKSLQQSKGTSSEEYNARKLYEENEFLKAQLDRTSRSYEQLRKDYNEVKREKDHALNRLSSVAGEKLRNNNPGIADLSDENRPINLGEKFSQLYDDQWTDAIEHLEEMGYSETDGIRRLLDILKAVFDECVKLSDTHFNQLKELTGTSHLPSDQLKKLKDLRKATAVHSVAKIKQVVNDYMSTAFSKEKAACQTYIDRSIELCWLMSVQDPPVVIDFIAVHGQAIDDKILRKFTKTGSKIDFLVWPVIRLHKNGPLLQKGVVQPI